VQVFVNKGNITPRMKVVHVHIVRQEKNTRILQVVSLVQKENIRLVLANCIVHDAAQVPIQTLQSQNLVFSAQLADTNQILAKLSVPYAYQGKWHLEKGRVFAIAVPKAGILISMVKNVYLVVKVNIKILKGKIFAMHVLMGGMPVTLARLHANHAMLVFGLILLAQVFVNLASREHLED